MVKTQQYHQQGLSLIELSIVLVVIAIIIGSVLSVGTSSNEAARITQTKAKLDIIEQALAGYVALQGRLPCPATPSLALTHASFGVENISGGTDCLGAASSSNVHIGSVPVTTLQLPDEFAFDGWGRRFSYAVDIRFAMSSGSDFRGTAGGAAEINVGTAVDSGDVTANAVYSIISHGSDGGGAWPRNGGTQRADSANAVEAENSHQAGGNPFDVEFVLLPRSSTFNDFVRYKMKYQLVRDAGGVVNDTVCDNAQTVLELGSTDYCGPAPDDANCDAFLTTVATEVSNLCVGF